MGKRFSLVNSDFAPMLQGRRPSSLHDSAHDSLSVSFMLRAQVKYCTPEAGYWYINQVFSAAIIEMGFDGKF